MDQILIKDFTELLNDVNTNENIVQEFLEENTELIPLPILENHHLHFNCVISKLKIGLEVITDFAYLTKSSDIWRVILIELESPHKRIFKKNAHGYTEFSAEFNNAIDQITYWKVYIEEYKTAVLRQLEKIRVPLEKNKVVFEYVLVLGRNKEKDNSDKRRSMFAEKSETMHIKFMTYDSLISKYTYYTLVNNEKIILSPCREMGFKIKKLPKNKIDTSIFSHVYPEYLQVTEEQFERLKKEGYEMDEWKNNNLLRLDNRKANIDIATLMTCHHKNKV